VAYYRVSFTSTWTSLRPVCLSHSVVTSLYSIIGWALPLPELLCTLFVSPTLSSLRCIPLYFRNWSKTFVGAVPFLRTVCWSPSTQTVLVPPTDITSPYFICHCHRYHHHHIIITITLSIDYTFLLSDTRTSPIFIILLFSQFYHLCYTHTHTHTYIHTYIYTYIHVYIHTYIHVYIHTYIPTRR